MLQWAHGDGGTLLCCILRMLLQDLLALFVLLHLSLFLADVCSLTLLTAIILWRNTVSIVVRFRAALLLCCGERQVPAMFLGTRVEQGSQVASGLYRMTTQVFSHHVQRGELLRQLLDLSFRLVELLRYLDDVLLLRVEHQRELKRSL